MKTIILVLFFVPLMGISQFSTIQGVVQDEEKEALPFAVITLHQGDQVVSGVQTDLEGNFKMEHLDPGIYSLKISFLGKEKVLDKIELSPGKILVLKEQMKPGGCIIDICGAREVNWSYTHMPSGMVLRAEDFRWSPYRR